jgi:hypothetical protein
MPRSLSTVNLAGVGQLNRALVLLLAAEFQGFGRELHDLASPTFSRWAALGNASLGQVIDAIDWSLA